MPVSRVSRQLSRIVASHPTTHDAIARAVFEENASDLMRLFQALGLDPRAERVEQLLADPGPFLPPATAWT